MGNTPGVVGRDSASDASAGSLQSRCAARSWNWSSTRRWRRTASCDTRRRGLRADLQRLKRDSSSVSNTADASRRQVLPVLPWWRSKLAIGMGGLVLVCVIFAAVFYGWHRPSLAGSSGPRLAHRQITFVGDAYAPAISPDGKSVAYVTGRDGSDEKLMLQDLSDGASLELLHGHLAGPRWSPDGGELMLSLLTDEGRTRGTFVVSRLGGTPRRVGRGRFSCWLPDGSQIVNTARGSGLRNQVGKQANWSRKTHTCSRIPVANRRRLFGKDRYAAASDRDLRKVSDMDDEARRNGATQTH